MNLANFTNEELKYISLNPKNLIVLETALIELIQREDRSKEDILSLLFKYHTFYDSLKKEEEKGWQINEDILNTAWVLLTELIRDNKVSKLDLMQITNISKMYHSRSWETLKNQKALTESDLVWLCTVAVSNKFQGQKTCFDDMWKLLKECNPCRESLLKIREVFDDFRSDNFLSELKSEISEFKEELDEILSRTPSNIPSEYLF